MGALEGARRPEDSEREESMAKAGSLPPPTIARLREMGVEGVFAVCGNADCRHSAPISFDVLGVQDDVFFPEIIRRRKFVCSQCGGRVASLTPDWRGLKASGMGKGANW